jgi:uncharacterized protein (TIGR02646 family)
VIGFTRGEAPEVMTPRRVAGWTARWVSRVRAGARSSDFQWPTVDARSLRDHVVGALLVCTADHCAYCDGYPIDDTQTPQVDHFLPKVRHPDLAFAWANLYPCCAACNGAKGDKETDDALLRPDAPEYSFERYYIFDRRSGEVQPNPAANAADRERAWVTLAALGVNAGSRPTRRLAALRRAERDPDACLDELPYRFVVLA